MKNISAITVNWLTARRTLGAVKSIKKYYPNIPLFIIDDGSDKKDKDKFFQVYKDEIYQPEKVYDPSTDILKRAGIFIQVPTHRRHGESIDYALRKGNIKTKWVFHIDSDVRLKKAGVIEYMLNGVDDSYCGVGIQKVQNPEYPKVFNTIFLFRRDLYKKYHLKMKPIYKLGLEANTRYFKFLTSKGYKIKYLGSGIKDYYVHLRYEKGKEDEWNKYY
jgi:hypothetical protein